MKPFGDGRTLPFAARRTAGWHAHRDCRLDTADNVELASSPGRTENLGYQVCSPVRHTLTGWRTARPVEITTDVRAESHAVSGQRRSSRSPESRALLRGDRQRTHGEAQRRWRHRADGSTTQGGGVGHFLQPRRVGDHSVGTCDNPRNSKSKLLNGSGLAVRRHIADQYENQRKRSAI
jgi:hypothetical protein